MIDWTIERAAIAAAAALHCVDPDFIEAIRVAEDRAGGIEFGVLDVDALTYDDRLKTVCVEVAHKLSAYPDNPLSFIAGKSRYNREFISWFSGKWAPAGAEVDPQGINVNWYRNAWKAYCERTLKA